MKWIFIALIGIYQKCISPNKGFSCAYRKYYGGPSCSQVAKQMLMEHGVILGFRRIKSQFAACGEAAKKLKQDSLIFQRLDLDCGLNISDACKYSVSFKKKFSYWMRSW